MVCCKCEQFKCETTATTSNSVKVEFSQQERLNALRVQFVDIILLYKDTFNIIIIIWVAESLFTALIFLNCIYCLMSTQNVSLIDIAVYYYHFCIEASALLIICMSAYSVNMFFNRFKTILVLWDSILWDLVLWDLILRDLILWDLIFNHHSWHLHKSIGSTRKSWL